MSNAQHEAFLEARAEWAEEHGAEDGIHSDAKGDFINVVNDQYPEQVDTVKVYLPISLQYGD